MKKKIIVIALFLSSLSFWAFTDSNFAIVKNLDIFYSLFKEINMFYVDETDPEQMVKHAIDGMLKKTDPYTVYIPESKIEDFKFMTTGEYAGIGSLIHHEDDYIVISEPYKGLPADKAGLKAGDKIIAIDGKSMKGKTVSNISEFLKGEPGSKITLEIERFGQKEHLFKEITREKINLKSLPYYGMVNDSTGYFILRTFTRGAANEVRDAVKSLLSEGAKYLIFDLRNNGGGLLNEAINIVNLFVEKGNTVVSTKGRLSEWDKTYTCNNKALFKDIPLTILVNNHSASASEIVSGSMQDLDRAVVLGTRTYGKGLVQATRSLPYNAKVKLTTAKYYIPSGRCIQALDYTHRNKDGSVGKIADSLISTFYTQNNRVVYDGGGILPDISIESEEYRSVLYFLLSKQLIFKYATEYYARVPEISNPKEFSLSDKEYNDFVKWVEKQELTYESFTEKDLKDLIETAKKEKYYESSKEAFENLEKSLKHSLSKDLYTSKEAVTNLLEDELLTRYFYREGAVEHRLLKDKSVKKASEILSKPQLYHSILAGTAPESNVKLKKEEVKN